MTYEEYLEDQKKRISNNKNASMFARDSYSQNFQSNDQIFSEGAYKPWQSPYAFNPDLDTSQGLYKVAVMSGLEKDAQRVVKEQGGDSHEFFSGGFISDVLDILNLSSYGVVGMAKGKGFAEGVKNRESFSDDDALGHYGWTGKVLGLGLDIVLDPLTYIAPWKLLAKVPGVATSAAKLSAKALGEMTNIEIGDKVIKHREGGWTPLTFLANKFAYGFSLDKGTLRGIQELTDSHQASIAEIDQLMGKFSKIDPDVANKTLEFKNGALVRRNIDDVTAEMMRDKAVTPEQLDSLREIYKMIDDNANDLVDLGVLSKSTRDMHVDDYVTQTYEEFLTAKKSMPGKESRGIGIERKTRKDLTEAQRKELGIVEDAGVVLGATLMKQAKLLKDARLQDYIGRNMALTADDLTSAKYMVNGRLTEEGEKIFTKVPDSPRFELKRNIDERAMFKKVRTDIKKILKKRKKAVADDIELTRSIEKIEKEIDRLHELSKRNASEAISGIKQVIRTGGITTVRKKVPTSDGQRVLADQIKKFLNKGKKSERIERALVPSKKLLAEFLDTDAGIALEKAFMDPQMMHQWRSMDEFFEAVRHPEKTVLQEAGEALEPLTEAQQKLKLAKAERAQRKIGKLKQEKQIFEDTSKPLVEDVMNKLEDDYSDLLFQRQQILETMNINRKGNIAGKYVPKEVWEMVKGTFEPKKEFGEGLVMWFKKAKVIWNPSAYPRNMMSAMIQNWWRLGIGPWNVHKYIEASRIIKNPNDPIMKRMRKLGFHENTGVTNELIDNFLSSKEYMKVAQKQWGTSAAGAKKKIKAFNRWATGAYGHIDNVAKVAAFKHAVERGADDVTALRRAYSATYNYSHVTPFVQRLRTAAWGVPFITFNLKSVPLVASTIAYAPHRISVIGKARNALFEAAGVEAEQEAEAMPEWMRDSVMLRVPWKDSEGRSMYFDLTYIIPFGAIVDGEYLKNPIGQNPVLQTIKELSSNRTFTGHKIWLESDDRDTVIADMFIHVAKLVQPPLIAENVFPRGYKDDGTRVLGKQAEKMFGDTQDLGPGERNYYQEMFRLAGLNVTPFDLESRQSSLEYRRKEVLSQLLVQNDVLGEFNKPYIPEESDLNHPKPIYDRQVDPLGR